MDPLHPWIDADEVRRLAARLMKPSRDPEVSVADAGFDEGFVGFAANRASVTAPAPPPVPQQPPPPPPAPVPTPVTKPASEPSPAAARGPFLERIRQFRDWMDGQFSASGIFILDREGAVIFDENGHNRLHFLARSLALASRRPGTTAANVHVKIGAATTLEVIPVETAYGCLVLGAVVPEALPPAAVQSVMTALAEIAKPGDGSAR
jgi:hypothetical protein